MPVLDLQQQQTEVGRVRLGVLHKPEKGKARPVKLDRFRFTSPRKALLDTIAGLYGGEVESWTPPRGNAQWQVITNATEVPVIIPPQDPGEGQWYEMWSAGGCQRRCDGRTEKLSKQPCLCLAQGCEPEKRDCKLHTRVRVMLADVPSLGCWRVDTGSYYAAVELPGIAAMLAMANGVIPGKLILSKRSVIRQVEGRPQTFNFVVPVLDVDAFTPRELMSGRMPELIAERGAGVVEAPKRTAIAATVDYPTLIGAARNMDALKALRDKAQADGVLTDELRGMLNARARQVGKTTETAAKEPEVVDAELVEWPEPATVAGAA